MKITKPLILSTLAFTALLLPLTVSADHRDYRHSHYDDRHSYRYVKAKVVDVEPIFERGRRYQEPTRTCYSERSRYDANDRRGKALLGSVIGGVIGYQVGDKPRHKRIGAVAGAVIGASVAKNSSRDRDVHCETRYETRYEDRRLVGYDVEYKYKGRYYNTFTEYRPGRWIEVPRPRKHRR
ncbi:MAG: hypothetical protein CMP47_02295 [Rickettsiales bacterium]|nr:hypothetical protein [Rickettsiales bacterium]